MDGIFEQVKAKHESIKKIYTKDAQIEDAFKYYQDINETQNHLMMKMDQMEIQVEAKAEVKAEAKVEAILKLSIQHLLQMQC